jgi:hypothetical protein
MMDKLLAGTTLMLMGIFVFVIFALTVPVTREVAEGGLMLVILVVSGGLLVSGLVLRLLGHLGTRTKARAR